MLLQRTVTLKWELRGRRVVNLREVSYCNYLTRIIWVFWVDSRLLEVVKIERWSHIEVGQCRLFFFGWDVSLQRRRFLREFVFLPSLQTPVRAPLKTPAWEAIGVQAHFQNAKIMRLSPSHLEQMKLKKLKFNCSILLIFISYKLSYVNQTLKFTDLHKLQIKLAQPLTYMYTQTSSARKQLG